MLERVPRSSAGPARAAALAISLFTAAVFSLPGCGAEPPQTDREQIETIVLGFVEDIVDDNIEAACAKLSASGRGKAVAAAVAPGVPIRPATKDQCVHDGQLRGLQSPSLAGVYQNGSLRISEVRIHGRRASVLLVNGALSGAQYLSKTPGGWKINGYDFPVRD